MPVNDPNINRGPGEAGGYPLNELGELTTKLAGLVDAWMHARLDREGPVTRDIGIARVLDENPELYRRILLLSSQDPLHKKARILELVLIEKQSPHAGIGQHLIVKKCADDAVAALSKALHSRSPQEGLRLVAKFFPPLYAVFEGRPE